MSDNRTPATRRPWRRRFSKRTVIGAAIVAACVGAAPVISSAASLEDGSGGSNTSLVATPSLASLSPLHLYLLVLSARLTSNGDPLANEPITFSAAGQTLCSHTTNVRGIAKCQVYVPLSRLLSLLTNGGSYIAVFSGDDGLNPAVASAPLLR